MWNTVKYFLPSAISLDSLIVAVAPKPPANHLRDGDGDDDDDEEEELVYFYHSMSYSFYILRMFMFSS